MIEPVSAIALFAAAAANETAAIVRDVCVGVGSAIVGAVATYYLTLWLERRKQRTDRARDAYNTCLRLQNTLADWMNEIADATREEPSVADVRKRLLSGFEHEKSQRQVGGCLASLADEPLCEKLYHKGMSSTLLLTVVCLVSVLSVACCAAKTASASSFYVRHDPDNKAVIIFVHGVTGDSKSTWTSNRTKQYWPDMLKSDSQFDGTNIFVYGYKSPLLGEALTIGELGSDLRLVLSDNKIFRHKWIAFLMHSMGGVIARSFLIENGRQDYIKNVKLLYFLATPTVGSQLAAIFGLVSQNPQFADMKPADRANKLGEEFRMWLSGRFDIASYCAYETEKTPSGIWGVPPLIVVDMTNALALCNRPADPIQEANHITIAQPDDQTARQYIAFRNAFIDTMTASTHVLKGMVVENERRGRGMADIPITVEEEENETAVSKDDGKFFFEFINKEPGDTVHLRVNKEGYAVVNDVQLEVTIPKPDARPLAIILCKEADRKEMARRFYSAVSSDGINESYKKQLRLLEDQHQATEVAVAKLNKEREQANNVTQALSGDLADREELARAEGLLTEPGKTSELYREAKHLFLDEAIEQAIALLDGERLRTAFEQEKAVDDAVESWLLKALLSSVQLRFDNAEESYLAAIDLAKTVGSNLELATMLYHLAS